VSVTTTATTRVYSSGIAGRLAALLTGLVAFGFPALVLREMLGIRESRLLIAVCVGMLVVGGVWVLVHVFVTGPVRFETDAQTVRLRRGLRVSNQWRRADTSFASLVERQSTNGIPTGAARKLFATTATERTEVLCRWFSASTFNDLMADLAPVAPGAAAGAAGGSEFPVASGHRTFALDPRAGALRGAGRSVVIVLVVAVLVAFGLVGWFVATDPTADPEALVFAGAAALFVVLVVLIAGVSGRRRRSRIPSSISVGGATVQIDGRTFYFTQLQRVSVTPPSYSGNLRRLVLVESTGAKTTYALGSTARATAAVFPDYAEFVDRLAAAAPAGVVRFDLT
jgi:hypothetical protein